MNSIFTITIQSLFYNHYVHYNYIHSFMSFILETYIAPLQETTTQRRRLVLSTLSPSCCRHHHTVTSLSSLSPLSPSYYHDLLTTESPLSQSCHHYYHPLTSRGSYINISESMMDCFGSFKLISSFLSPINHFYCYCFTA